MSRCRFTFILLCLAFLLTHRILAQQAPGLSLNWPTPQKASPANSDSPQTKIVTNTELVLVPVILTEKKGQPLSGVAKEAFRLEEDGKKQDISVFEEVTTASMTPKTVPAADNNDQEVTNFVPDLSHPTRLTIVVMDMLNTPMLRQEATKQALIKYLSRSITRDEPTALFGLNREGLRELHPFATDTAALVAALKKVKGQYSAEDLNESIADMDNSLTDSLANSADSTALQITRFLQNTEDTETAYYQTQSARQTLSAFKQIAEAYKEVPGRKTLIWASSGFPFMIDDPTAFDRMGLEMVELYEQTWRALIAANVAVYPIDVLGVVNSTFTMRNSAPAGSGSSFSSSTSSSSSGGSSRGGGGGGAGRGGGGGGGGRGGGGRPSGAAMGGGNPGASGGFDARSSDSTYDQHTEQQATMRAFASATGGSACLNSNGLEKCFADAVNDSRTYYMLGFYLRRDDTAPGWRNLDIKVAVSGARVRAREGFYVSAPTEDTPQYRQKQIGEALLSSVSYTGLRLKVRAINEDASKPEKITLASAAKTKQPANFRLTIPAENFILDQAKKNVLDLEIAAVAFDKKGNPADRDSHSVTVTLDSAKLAVFSQKGLTIKEVLSLPPGSYELRFAVRNNATGQIGTIQLPFDRN
jgi:VWFA-related protein